MGTFTPIAVVIFDGRKRKVMLISIWPVALIGVVLKTLYFDVIPEWVGLIFYIGFAWLGAFYFAGMIRLSGWPSVIWCLAGGFFYTTGAVLEFARVPLLIPGVLGPHEIFHLAIVMGVLLHWICLENLMRHVSSTEGEETWWDRSSKSRLAVTR